MSALEQRAEPDPFTGPDRADALAATLDGLRSKGVRFWSENGQLRYKSPKGALTRKDLETLKGASRQISALLEESAVAAALEAGADPGRRFDRVPLTFTQLSHWQQLRLGERRSSRDIAFATRLTGNLDVQWLRRAVAETVRRHDALRTRIVVVDGSPIQEIALTNDHELEVADLTGLAEDQREAAVRRVIDEYILEPVAFSVGPLFGTKLLQLNPHDHVLIVAMDHMVSDWFSLSILLRDLFVAYAQASKGDEYCLPEIPVQFSDYAVWQRSAQKSMLERHGAYWDERLLGCRRVRFPTDGKIQNAADVGWATVPLRIGRELKAELSEWRLVRRTTLAISVFTAYVALVLRWCNVPEVVLQYRTNGRVNSKVENTIGYFASVVYVRVELLEGDSFVTLMNRLTVEYCKACEHADFSYLQSQTPELEFARNSIFNWIPQEVTIDHSGLAGLNDPLTSSPIPFTNPALGRLEWDNEPSILLFDTQDEITGSVYFPLNRFSSDSMEKFGRNLLIFIETLLRHPGQCVKDIALV